ncbi:MAG: PIN domain-containing protein [Candidatus Dormibacteria bacterium]
MLDTSAFGRAFEAGPHQAEVLELLDSRRAVISMLVVPEARGIVNTKIRRGLSPRDAERLWRQLQHGLALARRAPVEVEDYERAQKILVGSPTLVAADALHVAVAMGIAGAGARVTFLTADERQASVAGRLLDEVRLLA